MTCLHSTSGRLLIISSYITVFSLGVYISKIQPYNQTLSFLYKYQTKLVDKLNVSSNNVSRQQTFADVGIRYGTDKVVFHHYESLYEKNLRKYVNSDLYLLEIGLGCGMQYGPGASAYVWRSYFGPLAHIHFIEFDKKCGQKWYEDHGIKVEQFKLVLVPYNVSIVNRNYFTLRFLSQLNVTIHFGSQDNVTFLQSVNSDRGSFDVIVDDGGHTMVQQITSLTHLLSKVRSGGIYIIEDLHTSYIESFGGGYRLNSTTLELIKNILDDIQSESPRKTTSVGAKVSSFEIGNKICFFNVR
jgi:hypothetical protein